MKLILRGTKVLAVTGLFYPHEGNKLRGKDYLRKVAKQFSVPGYSITLDPKEELEDQIVEVEQVHPVSHRKLMSPDQFNTFAEKIYGWVQ